MEHSQAPVTRRELRLADKRAYRRQLLSIGGVRAPVLDLLRRAITLPAPAAGTAAVAVAVSAALMGGGTAQVYTQRVAVAANELAAAAAVAAARQEAANLARSTLAGGSRLEGRAAAYAVSKRGAALVVARAAVANADSVAVSAVADVSPESLTALDEARATLSALIAAAPAPVVLRPADVFATATPPVSNVAAPAAAAATTAADPPPPDDPTIQRTSPTSPTSPTTPSAPVDVEPVARNLELSAQMVAAAQVVTELSGQVEAAAAANIAANAAADAAAAVAAAATDEFDRKIDAADDSPNGDIAADVLCGVGFAPKALMRCDAARALEQLNEKHRADLGSDLSVSSSYRSYAAQVDVKALRGDLAAAPGSSVHGRALAVDFAGFGSVGEYTDPTYRWMKANAGRFGWSHPEYMEPGGAGPPEPWHWEFAAD